MANLRNLHIGCAGWQVPKTLADDFGGEGTHLQRYAHRVGVVEVNSSFYKEHRHKTWAKWHHETPDGFRFAVKAPRWLTHDQGLKGTQGLDAFLEQIGGLGHKLGPVLLQLPPKLAFEPETMRAFFASLRTRHSGPVVCEPRHASWLTEEADAFLEEYRVARPEVDPSRHAGDDEPGGWPGLRYIRLHGSPQRFYSEYEEPWLREMAQQLRAFAREAETWCLFNNTARDGGARNALTLRQLVEEEPVDSDPVPDPVFDLSQGFSFYRSRGGPAYLLNRFKPGIFRKRY
jgi:uncharacterized protein YecE (DUF72 family)